MSKKATLWGKFATDNDREENGVWVNFGDGIRVKVRRMKSRISQETRKELEKPYLADIRKGGITEEQAKEMLLQQISQAIISDWEGVTDKDGATLPCTPAAKYNILKALPEFLDEIFVISTERDNYKAVADEDTEKNS